MRSRRKINLILCGVMLFVVLLFWVSLEYGMANDPEFAPFHNIEPTPEMLYGLFVGLRLVFVIVVGHLLGLIIDDIGLFCRKNPRD